MLDIREMSSAEIRSAIIDGTIKFPEGRDALKNELLALGDIDLLRRAAQSWESFQKESRQSRKAEVYLRRGSSTNVEVFWANRETVTLEEILGATKQYFPDNEPSDLVIDLRTDDVGICLYKLGT